MAEAVRNLRADDQP